MVNASGHIEQQLSKLQSQTADIATELETLVDRYLLVLSEASKRQLVLAAYHVCTQVYPDSFLDLSLSQRDRLQKQLRDLGNRIESQLIKRWTRAKRLSLQPAEEDGLAVIRQLFLEAASARQQATSDAPKPPAAADEDSPLESSSAPEESSESSVPEADAPSQDNLLAEIRSLMEDEPDEPGEPAVEQPGPMQPTQIMRRQILIEKAIRDVLKTVSENANDILRQAGVMPQLPQALLAAAAESERLGHSPMKTPNLVRLSIKVMHEPDKDSFTKEKGEEEPEPDDNGPSEQWPDDAEISATIIRAPDREEPSDDEADDTDAASESISMPRFLQLESLPDFVMIHLRLSEIEFAETNVAVWRSRIRRVMGRLKRVGHAYKDAERQLAIAQAEDAWRASWIND